MTRALGLDPSDMVAFLEASQPDQWEPTTKRLFEKPGFRDALMRYLAESHDEVVS